jgi:hypothetical protein
LTVVVSKRDGLNGALRGSGFGPCTEAVILSDEVGAMRVDCAGAEDNGISRYADPEAEGIMEVWRTGEMSARFIRSIHYSLQYIDKLRNKLKAAEHTRIYQNSRRAALKCPTD